MKLYPLLFLVGGELRPGPGFHVSENRFEVAELSVFGEERPGEEVFTAGMARARDERHIPCKI